MRPAPPLRRPLNEAAFMRRSERLTATGHFIFLNRSGTLEKPQDWNDPRQPKLWLYNLHYFDWLSQIGGADHDARSMTIERWIADNPPGHGNGWEPYTLSLRIVNWIKWALSEAPLTSEAIQSLAVQVRFLSQSIEYHLLGNHLMANAKALYAAGCFFDGDEAAKWKALAEELLDEQIREQILPDGGHFERSPMYHAIILEDVLDVMNVGRIYDMHVTAAWVQAAEHMYGWLAVMTRRDGKLPLFNDATYGVAPEPAELMVYGSSFGLRAPSENDSGLRLLGDTGYFRWNSPDYQVFGDVAPIGPDYIPGHAHADMLSFEMLVGADAVILHTGTSTYDVGARRALERGTAAHNTVQLGELDQSEMWGSFRVGHRGRIIDRSTGMDWIEATHTGYTPFGALHARRFCFREREIQISDTLDRQRCMLPARAYWHLAPGIEPAPSATGMAAGPVTFAWDGAQRIDIIEYIHAPGFNFYQPAKCIVVSFDQRLVTSIQLN